MGFKRRIAEREQWQQLSSTQQRVAELLMRGDTREGISQALACSPKTFDTHRASVLRKLGLGNNVQLTHFGLRNKIVTLEGQEDPHDESQAIQDLEHALTKANDQNKQARTALRKMEARIDRLVAYEKSAAEASRNKLVQIRQSKREAENQHKRRLHVLKTHFGRLQRELVASADTLDEGVELRAGSKTSNRMLKALRKRLARVRERMSGFNDLMN